MSKNFELNLLSHTDRDNLFDQQEAFFNQLRGNILTIIEAIITNESQLKATKDLIHNEFNQKITHLREYCFMYDEEASTEISEEESK